MDFKYFLNTMSTYFLFFTLLISNIFLLIFKRSWRSSCLFRFLFSVESGSKTEAETAASGESTKVEFMTTYCEAADKEFGPLFFFRRRIGIVVQYQGWHNRIWSDWQPREVEWCVWRRKCEVWDSLTLLLTPLIPWLFEQRFSLNVTHVSLKYEKNTLIVDNIFSLNEEFDKYFFSSNFI